MLFSMLLAHLGKVLFYTCAIHEEETKKCSRDSSFWMKTLKTVMGKMQWPKMLICATAGIESKRCRKALKNHNVTHCAFRGWWMICALTRTHCQHIDTMENPKFRQLLQLRSSNLVMLLPFNHSLFERLNETPRTHALFPFNCYGATTTMKACEKRCFLTFFLIVLRLCFDIFYPVVP